MHFTDHALVLSARKHGENTALMRVLAREHGIYSGAVRGISGKGARGLWQPGNRVLVTWKARLAEQMGSFTGELVEANAAYIMSDGARLSALTCAASLIEQLMPERHPYPGLYATLEGLVQALKSEKSWAQTYARFELALLAECGFRLDLTHCASTGKIEDLCYVSPKSGRAVSREAGAPYKELMLPLPAFLTDPANAPSTPEHKEILDSLRLTGYFLARWVLEPHGWRMPAARGRLLETLHKSVEHV